MPLTAIIVCGTGNGIDADVETIERYYGPLNVRSISSSSHVQFREYSEDPRLDWAAVAKRLMDGDPNYAQNELKWSNDFLRPILKNKPWMAKKENAAQAAGWLREHRVKNTLALGTMRYDPVPQGFDHMEIHCHGMEGRLLTGLGVRENSLDTDGGLDDMVAGIRRLMPRGGTIEFLSCLTAGIPASSLRRFIAAETAILRGTWPQSAFRNDGENLMTLAQAYCDYHVWEKRTLDAANAIIAPVKGSMTTAQFKDEYERQKRNWYSLLIPPRSRLNAEILPLFAWAAQDTRFIPAASNGPRFCSTIATRTGCRVRSSDRRQIQEEDGKTYSAEAGNPIGNWDGNIFDFWPNGDIAYVGYNVPRSMKKQQPGGPGDGPTRTAGRVSPVTFC